MRQFLSSDASRDTPHENLFIENHSAVSAASKFIDPFVQLSTYFKISHFGIE